MTFVLKLRYIMEPSWGQLADQGIAILVVEQFARTALAIADVAAIMVHGVVTRAGRPDELTDEVSAAYLGATA